MVISGNIITSSGNVNTCSGNINPYSGNVNTSVETLAAESHYQQQAQLAAESASSRFITLAAESTSSTLIKQYLDQYITTIESGDSVTKWVYTPYLQTHYQV